MADELGWPAGWGLRELAEVDSTMAEARRLAPGLAGPEWILAHRQTAGHGRRGRPWASRPGNFSATLVLPDAGGPAQAALRSFTAALALAEALDGLTGDPAAVALKWPNDVLLQGGKVAGILLEMLPEDRLSIGIGVNLASAPAMSEVEPHAVPPVAVQALTGQETPPFEFLIALAAAFAGQERQLTSFGFAPVRLAWLARAARLGQGITARTGTEELHGKFETIDETGRLILALDGGGKRAIPAAEIGFA